MTEYQNTKKRELFALILAFTLPLLIMSLILWKEGKEVSELVLEAEPEIQKIYKFNPDIVAKSAMVTELNSGQILYAKNADLELPIASITKLMTTLVAIEEFHSKGLSRVQINENHLTAFGDSGLLVGQVWQLKDLVDFTLITSSNDGAQALAASAFGEKNSNFISKMNQMSQKLGLANTYFLNETGLDLDETEEVGAISSARDITKVLQFITKHNLNDFTASAIATKSINVDGQVYDIENTNKSIKSIPGALISKTGYTELSGGNLAIVADFGLNNPVSIVVLGSTLEDRENDVLNLIDETKNYYSADLNK